MQLLRSRVGAQKRGGEKEAVRLALRHQQLREVRRVPADDDGETGRNGGEEGGSKTQAESGTARTTEGEIRS